MIPRRLNNNSSSMTNPEYRIDLNPEEPQTLGEEVVNQVQPPPSPHNDMNNDHLQQLIHLLKENLTTALPFALILILKAFYEHSAGICMVVFFSASIYHANTVLVEQTALKSSRHLFPLIRVILILISSLILFLYLFREDQFYFSLIFLRPSYSTWTLWTLLWVLYSTFCIVKMLVMIIKGFLILIPLTNEKGKSCLTFRKRGSYFSLIEYLSQFYISLLTIPSWIHFLMDKNQGNVLFSSFLLFFYSLIKIYHLYKSSIQLRRSLKEAFQTLPFPSVSPNELRDNLCPICQSDYQDPIILTCKHVFCEECVSSWLDRNASCPLCRCKLPIGQANFRDGFTSGYLIWY